MHATAVRVPETRVDPHAPTPAPGLIARAGTFTTVSSGEGPLGLFAAAPIRPGTGSENSVIKLLTAARDALDCSSVWIATRGADETDRLLVYSSDNHGSAQSQMPAADATTARLGDQLAGGRESELSMGDMVIADRDLERVAVATLNVHGDSLGRIYAVARGPGHSIDLAVFRALASHIESAMRYAGPAARAVTQVIDAAAVDLFESAAISVVSFFDLIQRLDVAFSSLIGPVRTGVMLWDEGRRILRSVAGSFGGDMSLTSSHQTSGGNLVSVAGRVLTLDSPYLSNHGSGDPGQLQPYRRCFGVERIVAVPLYVASRPVGVLCVTDKATDFTAADLQLCARLAPRVAMAVTLTDERVKLHRVQKLEGLIARVATKIASAECSRDFVAEAVEELRAITGTSFVAIVPNDEEPVVAKSAEMLPEADNRMILSSGQPSSGQPWTAQHLVRHPDGPGDPGSVILEAPVRLASQHAGRVLVLRPGAESFSTDECRCIESVATLATLPRATGRDLGQRATLARLQERERIADDLHDDVAQFLYAANVHLETALGLDGSDPGVSEQVARARTNLARGDAALRMAIGKIAPPPERDMPARLVEIASDLEEEYAIDVQLDISSRAATAAQRLSPRARALLARAAREALTNAAKHAAPCRARLELAVSTHGRLRLTVADDGPGISERARRCAYGLRSLRASAARQNASLRICGGADGGSIVTLSFPA